MIVFGYEYKTPNYGQLYIINLENSDMYSITETGGYFTSPDWSPDGESILFRAGDYSPPGIWVSKADGSDKEYIADGYLASWSPRGDLIAIAKISRGESYGNNKVEVLLFNLPSNSMIQLFSVEEGYPEIEEITWSPNGRYLTFLLVSRYEEWVNQKWSKSYGFYVYELHNNTFLEKMSFDVPIYEINWSQDSKKLLYVGDQYVDTENRFNATFHVWDIESGECHQFKTLGVTGGLISPDGSKLLQEETGGQIFLIDTSDVFPENYWETKETCLKFP